MILLWLAAPIMVAVVVVMAVRLKQSEYPEVARRSRAMKVLEENSGSGLPDDSDRAAGWFVSPDYRGPRRVRLFWTERSTAGITFEEAEAKEASVSADSGK